jgi:D-glycero-alpha-D-manno-heptose 1-phosphate guanylyltransferase
MKNAVVLCGGFGTRLGELTRNTPKPMLAVAGRPFIAHILDELHAVSVEQIILAAGFAWQQLEAYVGHAWRGVPVRYSVEATPLGTGGALRRAMHDFSLDTVLALNGDSLFRVDLAGFLRAPLASGKTTRIALRQVADCSRYGRVSLDDQGRVIAFGEKGHVGPGLINGGIYLQRFDPLERFGHTAFSFEADYLAAEFQSSGIEAVHYDAYFIDIGIPEDFARAQRELLRRGVA